MQKKGEPESSNLADLIRRGVAEWAVAGRAAAACAGAGYVLCLFSAVCQSGAACINMPVCMRRRK
jgi:hypothetical protein